MESSSSLNAIIWFRKGLRIHDNPALELARMESKHLFPVFVLDPYYVDPDGLASSPGSARAGINRIQFLLESLVDLDSGLRRLGSRLLVLKGEPVQVMARLLKDWKIGKLYFEFDTEPYAQSRDNKVKDIASASGIQVFSPVSHTLFDPKEIIRKNGGKAPLTYKSFVAIAGKPSAPLCSIYSLLPPIGDVAGYKFHGVPSIHDLGYKDVTQEFSPFRGGETEALKRLNEALANKKWVAEFEKPKGNPSEFIMPATTVLSPYLKFGCLSSRYFFQRVDDVYKTVKKHTLPPVSLAGQLFWRDFFYVAAFGTPNFDKMHGNKICKQIPWRDDEKLFEAWRDGHTGYPWIDAIMIQLKKWGWMHHLARHSVACFLTRGDLFIHWEKGRDVFERLLIDSDWAINNGNWLWLSCSSFFYQYNRIYSPISFGKKYDPNGNFIRHFLPALKDMPKKYIYEPWTAPLSIQSQANCIIGKDYPKPVVSHDIASKECKRQIGAAYALNLSGESPDAEEKLIHLRRKLEEDDHGGLHNRKQKKRISK
ncbi:(6-4)DNA photolyase [Phalaenopsis equestris]|uniref:(6-4)DNA photolyase n=1 Tax=Phalaenopsis equestris TaxID=78828 RepID=UPI0009E1AD6B|nr:(6-4)DNA photolyase [Phalaenopsis equestris]